jgi:hypothetical protein
MSNQTLSGTPHRATCHTHRSAFPAAAEPATSRLKRETIAIHGGYDVEPTTKAVAVPIYQTAAYAFDSADHGAALFNL